jgi:hypothetical protein
MVAMKITQAPAECRDLAVADIDGTAKIRAETGGNATGDMEIRVIELTGETCLNTVTAVEEVICLSVVHGMSVTMNHTIGVNILVMIGEGADNTVVRVQKATSAWTSEFVRRLTTFYAMMKVLTHQRLSYQWITVK